MKVLPFQIPESQKESIIVERDKMHAFYNMLHSHVELQLTAIVNCTGNLYIGDRIELFSKGDVFLIGSNLPHFFSNNAMPDGELAQSISIYFKANFLGDDFLAVPEASYISKLLLQASRGLKLGQVLGNVVKEQMLVIEKSHGLQRISEFINTLNNVGTSSDFEPLSSLGFRMPEKESDSKKINDVYSYVVQNYSRPLPLDEIAAIASLAPTAFCRYFKHHTRKTFSTFLSEIRIGNACKLLIEGAHTVSEISYKCGFNNISNFNRKFKNITGYPPTDYLKKMRSHMN